MPEYQDREACRTSRHAGCRPYPAARTEYRTGSTPPRARSPIFRSAAESNRLGTVRRKRVVRDEEQFERLPVLARHTIGAGGPARLGEQTFCGRQIVGHRPHVSIDAQIQFGRSSVATVVCPYVSRCVSETLSMAAAMREDHARVGEDGVQRLNSTPSNPLALTQTIFESVSVRSVRSFGSRAGDLRRSRACAAG